MKRASTLLPFLLFITFNVFAQKNLQPAYIINNSGDTAYGFINFKEWYRNPVSVSFAETKESTAKKYTISEIQEFGITGKEQYRRFFVTISMDKETLAELRGKDTSYRSESIYLKTLYSSDVLQLFSYTDDLKSRLYILTKDETTPIELKHSRYFSNADLINDNEYRNILLGVANKYAPGNKALTTKIISLDYLVTDILKVCYAIGGKEQPEVIEKGAQKFSKFRFYAGAGIGISLLKVSDNDKYAGNIDQGSVSPLFALGGDIFFNPYIGRLFFRTNISYTSYKSDGHVYKKLYTWEDNYYLKFKQNNLSIDGTVNFNLYNKKDFRYFIGIGPRFNFSSYPLNEETLIRETFPGVINTVKDPYFSDLNKFWINGVVNTGFMFDNLELSASYSLRVGLSSALSSIDNSSLNVRLAYFFKR